MIDSEALKNIEKLHQMKSDGVISEAEFNVAKERLLSSRQAAAPKADAATLPAANDHIGWMLLPLRRYAEFHGRSTRKEFWMFQLTFLALLLGCAVLGFLIGAEAAAGLFLLGLLGMLVPLLAVQVRRFHDQDRSGWFALLNIIPYVGSIIIWVFMLFEGTRGDNSFGPDPKD